MKHPTTIVRALYLEIGFSGELGLGGLAGAVIEALENGGLIDEAGIVYIKSSSPHQELAAVDIWAPEVDEETDSEPPTIPERDDSQPEPN